MENQDIRWVQRFDNYSKALAQLKSAVDLATKRPLSELEEQGLIQTFEFTHELAWNMLKDFLHERGNLDIFGSKDATRLAFKNEIITKGEIWMDMIKSRNKSSHTYNEDTANEIVLAITTSYIFEFEQLSNTFNGFKNNLS